VFVLVFVPLKIFGHEAENTIYMQRIIHYYFFYKHKSVCALKVIFGHEAENTNINAKNHPLLFFYIQKKKIYVQEYDESKFTA
jgi:hypothetical protein